MSNYRAPLRYLQADFRAGEVDPQFRMRVDSKAYPSGARALRNTLLSNTGGVSRRPGTQLFNQFPEEVRLVPFEYDANEKYVCAFGHGNVYFYDVNGILLTTLTGPWVNGAVGTRSGSMWEMTFLQKGDVMVIAHTDFKMRKITRTGLKTFKIETLAFSTDPGTNVINQPHSRLIADTVYMKSSNVIGGATTVVSSPGIFSAAWVGERVRIWEGEIALTAFTSATTMAGTVTKKIEQTLGIAPLRAVANSDEIEITHVLHGMQNNTPIVIVGAGSLFNIPAASINGNRTMILIDQDHYKFNCGTVSDTSGDGGGSRVRIQTTDFTRSWTEQVWSDRRGWPGAVGLHENRIWLGGSRGLPTFIAGSVVGDYFDFSVGDGLDDDSVQGTISAVSRVLHFASSKLLQIFTESHEAVVETRSGEPITPGTLKVTVQSDYGASPKVRPTLFDGATLFTQRSGKNVREFLYDFNTDSHIASPISVIASHLINAPHDVGCLSGSVTRPEQYAFFVNANGTIAVFHSIRSEQLAAWTMFTPGGPTGTVYDSVCVIGTSVIFSVRRNNLYWFERFELDRTDIWLDGATRLTGVNQVFNAGIRYANRIVTVMAFGQKISNVPGALIYGTKDAQGKLTVVPDPAAAAGNYTCNVDGAFRLPFIVTNPIVGYDYAINVTPNSPDKDMTDGPMTGERRRICGATVHFHATANAAINGQEQFGFVIGDDPSANPVLVSTKRKIRLLGYDRDPAIAITQLAPGPLTVLGMVMEVSI